MSKRKISFELTKCPYDGCDRILKNENNYNVHVKHCTKRTSKGSKKITTLFFPSKSPSREDVAGPSYTGEIVSLSSDDDVSNLGNNDHIEITNSPSEPPEKRFCDGIEVPIDRFHINYPFHRHQSDNPVSKLTYNLQLFGEKLIVHSE